MKQRFARHAEYIRCHAELVSASMTNLRKFIVATLLLILSLFVISCDNAFSDLIEDSIQEPSKTEVQSPYLVLTVEEASSRNVLTPIPDPSSRPVVSIISPSLFSDISLSGTRAEGGTISVSTANFTELAQRRIYLEEGSWTFNLVAYCGKTEASAGGKYTATQTLNVVSGANPLTMTLAPAPLSQSTEAERLGSWQATLEFPADTIDLIRVKVYNYSTFAAGITASSPAVQTLPDFVKGASYDGSGLQSVTTNEASLSMGSYVIYIEYFTQITYENAAPELQLLNTWAELLRINPGAKSEGTITLPAADPVYTIQYIYNEDKYNWVTFPTEVIPLAYTRKSGNASGQIVLPTSDSLILKNGPDPLYSFEGWYTTEDFAVGSGPVTEFPVSDLENKVFYAKWHEPVYDVYIRADGDDSNDGSFEHPVKNATAAYGKFADPSATNSDGSIRNTIHILSDYIGTDKIDQPWGDGSKAGMCVTFVGEKGGTANADVKLELDMHNCGSPVGPQTFIYIENNQRMKFSHINFTSNQTSSQPNGYACLSALSGTELIFEDSSIKGYVANGCAGINVEGVARLKNCEISENKAIDANHNPSDPWGCAVNVSTGTLHLYGNVVIKGNEILNSDGSNASQKYNLYLGSWSGTPATLNFLPLIVHGSLTGSEIYLKLAQEPRVFTTGYGTQAGEPSDYFHSDSGRVIDFDSSGEAQVLPTICYYVSSTSSSPAGSDTEGDGSISKPFASIAKAVEKITLNDDNTLAGVIYVDGEIPCNIIIDDGSVGSRLVAHSLTIQRSSTATQATLNGNTDADGAGDDSIILMSAQVPLTLKNLTLMNGNSTSSGGALCYDGRQLVTIDSCDFVDNEASVYGGALYFSNSDAAISNTRFTSNSATGTTSDYGQGGAIYIRGGNVSLSGSVEFTSNSAYRYGGAIALSSSSSSVLTLGKTGVESTITIKENTAGDPAQTDNIHLNDDQTIAVAGELSTDSEIGVIRTYSTSPFTTGYAATNSGTAPNTIFTSDSDYAVIAGTGGEAAFYMVSAGGTIYSPGDYHFTLAASRNSVTLGRAASVTVSPTITRTEPDGTTREIFYNASDHKLYLDSLFTLPAGGDNEVSWSASLWCGVDVEVPSLAAGTGSDANKFTIPALDFENTYTMNVVANYMGYPHDASFNLQCREAPAGGMVLIPHGSFKRAASSGATEYNITLTKDFYMCDHEVTQKEWEDVMGVTQAQLISAASGSDKGSGDDYPVYCVNWYHAIAYCNKKSLADGLTPCYSVSGVTDWAALNFASIPTSSDTAWNAATCDFNASGYRLPTEAEWEYAALGDYKDNTNWNGYGNSSDSSAIVFAGYDGTNFLDDYAWYTDTATDGKTHEAKGKAANSYNLYDMSGNVWEWCWDRFGSYASADVSDPSGASSGANRINRGGSWFVDADKCSVAHRYGISPSSRYYYLGFRVVRNAP